MVRLAGVAAVLCLCACYHPDFKDCAISCASGVGCPDGLTCDNGTKLCTTSGTSCQGGGDAGGDGSGSSSCGWPFTPTNFDPCDAAFPAATFSLDVANSSIMQDTDNAGCAYTYMGATYCLLHVTNVNIAAGFAFRPTGKHPMLIVSDGDIHIDGTVDASFNAVDPQGCGLTAAMPGNNRASGGGGGGGHTRGGGGGAGDNGAQTPPGTMLTDTLLSPLTMGCPGGAGGNDATLSGPPGANGGGAVQLVSKTMIKLTTGAAILANGAGGGGGRANNQMAAGGAGGGAGGAIFLETPLVDTDPNTSICAVGGGGGGGGDVAAPTIISNGTDGSLCSPGLGGKDTATNPPVQSGGTGGADAAPTNGADFGGGGSIAGGGGGGAGGRIRIKAPTRMLRGTVAPTPAN